MTSVVLVNPKMCSPRSARLPLSLLSLGAALEGKYEYRIIDGNVDDRAQHSLSAALGDGKDTMLAVTVMPGPQVAPAIAISSRVRDTLPHVPIVWGGYFPTLYPDAALNARYVDYVVRGQGEGTFLELLAVLPDLGPPLTEAESHVGSSASHPSALRSVQGLSWRDSGRAIHNADRPLVSPDELPQLPYHRLAKIERYFRPSFMGRRTAVHQAAIGCRYRCTFCGVVSMFNGQTVLRDAARLAAELTMLRDTYGADAVQFYDHNFFDREPTSVPILEVLADLRMAWWCYARADTLAKFSDSTWELIRRSRLAMTYVGAEAASNEVLRGMKKGSRVEHTLEAARRCREYGVIPEFSFVLGGPEDSEGEIERTFAFIKQIKKIHPECEIILYFYSPTPQRDAVAARRDDSRAQLPHLATYGPDGPSLPSTPEEWAEPRWVDYVCHRDAPWLTPRMRQRVRDFAKVLSCRFPTIQDYSTPRWGKRLLSSLAQWRYATGRYSRPWELELARRIIPLREPERESI